MWNAFVVLTFVFPCVADLRPASQPRNDWKTKQRTRNSRLHFQQDVTYYMEPSDFGYQGLVQQRANAYDNFLRSNIDNEQDRRNFDDEPGKDHLPFRNFEGMATDQHDTIEKKLPKGAAITVTPGVPFVVPFRWNNPHASEIEINLWLMNVPESPIVVPIRKPACSGEGYQDNVFTFTIPEDYKDLATKVPGFKGCEKVGDCVIQFYAHSVESRMYAHGVPVKINVLQYPAFKASNIEEVKDEPALDLTSPWQSSGVYMKTICESSNQRQELDHENAVPRRARLVSDVFNHAYQNSDFSPYAGQQPEHISRNLQASIILKMVPGNRGELGKRYFRRTNPQGQKAAARVDKIAKELIRVYEIITNQIINGIQNLNADGELAAEGEVGVMKLSDNMTVGIGDSATNQYTETCFRCEAVGSVNKKRLITNTYIPSFQITNCALCTQAFQYIAPIYGKLLNNKCEVQIYTAVLMDMEQAFVDLSAKHGVYYLGAAKKNQISTMEDTRNFIKTDASGNNDGGYYAAQQAQNKLKEWSHNFTGIDNDLKTNFLTNPAQSVVCQSSGRRRLTTQNIDGVLQAIAADVANETETTFATPMTPADANGLNKDTNCENDKLNNVIELEAAGGCHIDGYDIVPPTQLFAAPWQKQDGANSVASAQATWVVVMTVALTSFC